MPFWIWTGVIRGLFFALVVLAWPAALHSTEDVRSISARAVSLHRAGDLEGAVAAYREVITLDAANPETWSNLGAALAALGRYEEAIESYRHALAVVPGDVRIRYNLALAHYKTNELVRAAKELTALRQDRPDDLRATLLLADCWLRLGELGEVEELLRPVEAAQPDNRAVLYMLGMALVRGDKEEEGQRLVERLMQGGETAEAHYLLGSAAFMAEDYPQAEQEFSRARALNPKLPSLLSYHGRALLFTGDADGAESALRAALTADPNDYDAHYHLASILATRRRPGEARPFAERAVQLRPQSEGALSLLASLDQPDRLGTPADASPLVGQPAPDVELRRPDGSTYGLSTLRGQPVLLVFGSLSCPLFRSSAPDLNELHERFGDRVAFRMIYIREAHPAGESWESTINEREGVSLPAARSEAERAEHATACRVRLDIPYEIALDAMAGTAEGVFQAFPSRAFVIDRAGRVTFSMPLGEQSRPEALGAALEAAAR